MKNRRAEMFVIVGLKQQEMAQNLKLHKKGKANTFAIRHFLDFSVTEKGDLAY